MTAAAMLPLWAGSFECKALEEAAACPRFTPQMTVT